MEKKNIIVNVGVFLVGIVLIAISTGKINETNKAINKLEYRGQEGKTSFAVNSKLLGAQKFGADLLWIKQVLYVGGEIMSADEIKNYSSQISYLNPYFLGNYYFSGSIVSFIKTVDRPDYGIEILKKGVEYNPHDKTLKQYIAGIIAATKGNIDEVAASMEEIVKEYRDDNIINALALINREKYENTKEIKYLEKAVYYWIMNLDSKDTRYSFFAEKNLKKYNIKY